MQTGYSGIVIGRKVPPQVQLLENRSSSGAGGRESLGRGRSEMRKPVSAECHLYRLAFNGFICSSRDFLATFDLGII